MTKYRKIPVLAAVLCLLLSCTPRVAQVSEYSARPIDLRGLITVEDVQIRDCLGDILAGEDMRTDFRRIQDWVAGNVEYDAVVKQYWQRPSATIASKRGDCKDYSTLLCTLWRAWGVPASDVYVAIGQSPENDYHAFIIERHLNGKWQVVEPQMGGFITSDLGAIDTAEKYAISFLFNDVNYINQPADIYRVVKGNEAGFTPVKPVVKEPLPVINFFTADRESLPAGGGSVFLGWSVSGADYVAIDQGIGEVCATGTAQVRPLGSNEYKLVAMNSGGSTQASVSIKVAQPGYARPKPPPDEEPPPAFIVGFAGWYRGNSSLSTASAGQPVTARINVRGGAGGQYMIRAWRAVSQGNDEVVAYSSFRHDGSSSTGEITFTPSYFIGQAGTRGYWVDLMADGSQDWKMPNAYPPRLTVIPKKTTGELAISFAGWYKGVDAVSTATTGEDVTCGICLSGGTAGRYVLKVRRDAAGVSDEIVEHMDFDYDGTSAMYMIKFSPGYASNESGTRGYYLELNKDGVFLWSLNGSYPPRLAVTKSK